VGAGSVQTWLHWLQVGTPPAGTAAVVTDALQPAFVCSCWHRRVSFGQAAHILPQHKPFGFAAQGFKLIFAFKENPFFTNAELVKTYYMGDGEDMMLKRVESEWLLHSAVAGGCCTLGLSALPSCHHGRWRGHDAEAGGE